MTTTTTRKAVVACRYPRQGKAIRQVASSSSLCQRFPYAPFNAMVTKISKWSRIQDSWRITPKIESLVVYAMPDIPSKFQKDPSITFRVILLTHRQTDKQTKSDKNLTFLAEVITTTAITRLMAFKTTTTTTATSGATMTTITTITTVLL